jgi:putative salt-induced outer membrane protein YdiY
MKKYIFIFVSVFGLVSSLSSVASDRRFAHESEASVVISGGNSDLEVYNFKTLNRYTKTKNILSLGGYYTYGRSEGTLSARNWDAQARYERTLSEHFGVFAAYQYEQDKFRGFTYRQNYDLGLSYQAYKTQKHDLRFEAGYRLSREKELLSTETENFQKSRYASFYEFKSTRSWSLRFIQELLLNHSDSSAYIYTGEPSLNMVLTDTVSFKFGYKGIYENQPSTPGLRKYDYQITSGLIAKF